MKYSVKIKRNSSLFARLTKAARLRWVIDGVVFVRSANDFVCKQPTPEELKRMEKVDTVEIIASTVQPTAAHATRIEQEMRSRIVTPVFAPPQTDQETLIKNLISPYPKEDPTPITEINEDDAVKILPIKRKPGRPRKS